MQLFISSFIVGQQTDTGVAFASERNDRSTIFEELGLYVID